MLDGPGPLPVFTERNPRARAPHTCSATGNGVLIMGEVLGATPQVFLGRAEETCPHGLTPGADGPVPAIRTVGILVMSPDSAQIGLDQP